MDCLPGGSCAYRTTASWRYWRGPAIPGLWRCRPHAQARWLRRSPGARGVQEAQWGCCFRTQVSRCSLRASHPRFSFPWSSVGTRVRQQTLRDLRALRGEFMTIAPRRARRKTCDHEEECRRNLQTLKSCAERDCRGRRRLPRNDNKVGSELLAVASFKWLAQSA